MTAKPRLIDTRSVFMAAEQWMEIYRSYEAEELDAEIVQLRKDVRGGFAAQNHGGTGHQRDLAELRDRLAAATRVKNERRAGGNSGWQVGKADFSGNRWP